MKLVSTPFDCTGFCDWKRSVMIGLIAKNKLCFVDGSLPQPSIDDAHKKAWDRCNNMVIGWLIASLDRMVAKSVLYNQFASEIWRNLDERYGVSTLAQIYALHEDLSNISQDTNMTITKYFTKVKSVWDELDNLSPLPTCICNGCSCGLTKKVLKLQQDQRLMSFLMKVDHQYRPVKTNILMLPELPNVSMAYRMLYQEQKHKELARLHHSPSVPESLAFSSHKKVGYDKSSSHNARTYKITHSDSGVFNRMKSAPGYKRQSIYFCDHCKVNGHSTECCFKLHGFPQGFKHRKFAGCAQETYTKSDLENLGLTASQLDTLMALSTKHKESNTDGGSMDLDHVPGGANLAGPIKEQGSW